MKDDAQRTANYTAKTNAATVGLIVSALLPDMRTNFGDIAGMSDLVSKEQQIQGILNGRAPAVPTIDFPFYYAFGRECWAAVRAGVSGLALDSAVQGVRDKWNYKGFLTATILDEIAFTVFNVVTA